MSGKSFYFSTFTVIYLSNLEPVPVFAVNISKKVAKMAHDRNKLRRQIQQLIQTNLSSFPPHKYLFLPKNSAINSYSELKTSFTKLLKVNLDVILAKAGIHKF